MVTNTYGEFSNSIFIQIKYLVREKGMLFDDAITEIESKLHGKLPEHIKSLAREESYRW